MYKIISLFSLFIRQFVLPNPFVNIVSTNYVELVNYVFGGVLVGMAYIITGTWYTSNRKRRGVGSFGFLFNYALLTLITLGISYFIHNIYFLSGIILIIFIALCIVENKLWGK